MALAMPCPGNAQGAYYYGPNVEVEGGRSLQDSPALARQRQNKNLRATICSAPRQIDAWENRLAPANGYG